MIEDAAGKQSSCMVSTLMLPSVCRTYQTYTNIGVNKHQTHLAKVGVKVASKVRMAYHKMAQ